MASLPYSVKSCNNSVFYYTSSSTLVEILKNACIRVTLLVPMYDFSQVSMLALIPANAEGHPLVRSVRCCKPEKDNLVQQITAVLLFNASKL